MISDQSLLLSTIVLNDIFIFCISHITNNHHYYKHIRIWMFGLMLLARVHVIVVTQAQVICLICIYQPKGHRPEGEYMHYNSYVTLPGC